MAQEHEVWLSELLGGLPAGSKDALYEHLGLLRVHLAQRQTELDSPVSKTKRKPAA
jgi:hypothetical protein